MRNGQCFLRPNPAVLDIVVNNSGVMTTEDFGTDEKKTAQYIFGKASEIPSIVTFLPSGRGSLGYGRHDSGQRRGQYLKEN